MNFADIPDDIRERALACKSPEELLSLAKEEGYELSDEDLDAVNGGGDWDDRSSPHGSSQKNVVLH